MSDREGNYLYTCPKLCGWYRAIPRRRDHQIRMMNHMIYGSINGLDLARMEISTHECGQHKSSIFRLRIAQAKRRELLDSRSDIPGQ